MFEFVSEYPDLTWTVDATLDEGIYRQMGAGWDPVGRYTPALSHTVWVVQVTGQPIREVFELGERLIDELRRLDVTSTQASDIGPYTILDFREGTTVTWKWREARRLPDIELDNAGFEVGWADDRPGWTDTGWEGWNKWGEEESLEVDDARRERWSRALNTRPSPTNEPTSAVTIDELIGDIDDVLEGYKREKKERGPRET